MRLVEPPCFLQGVFDELVTLGNQAVRGIFDEEFQILTSEAEGRRLSLTVSRAVAQTATHGTLLEIGDRQFEVVGIEPVEDGLFVDLLLLELDPIPVLTFVNTNVVAIVDAETPLTFVNTDATVLFDGIPYIGDYIGGQEIFINGDPVILGA